MIHVPGIKTKAPDILSIHLTDDTHPPNMVISDDVHNIQD